MYKIVGYDDETLQNPFTIYDPSVGIGVSSGNLTLTQSDIDNAQLSVNRLNALYGRVRPFKTHINIYQDDELVFRGRALKPTQSMNNDGLFQQSFVFESIISYLLDSVQRYKEVHNTSVSQFFSDVITSHNEQVPTYKQFKVGNVTATNSTDNVYRYINYENTYDTIKDNLTSRIGGFLRLRVEDDGNYLDYLAEVGADHQDTPIQIGKNLKSVTLDVDPSSVITRLVPLGAEIQPDDTNDTNDTTNVDSSKPYPRVTIETVNGGKDYLDIPEFQNEFGVIVGVQEWGDVHEPSILLSKANDWIASATKQTESWSIEAVELLDAKFETFRVFDRYLFTNPEIADSQLLEVTEKEIDFAKPQSSVIKIGAKQKKITDYQKQVEQKIDDKTQESTDKAVQLFDRMHTIVNLKGQEQTEALTKLGNDLGLKQTDLQNNLDALLKQITDIDSTVTDVSNWINSKGTATIQADPAWSNPQSLRAVNADGSAMVFNANGLGYYSNSGLVRSAIDSQGRIVAESITGGTITGVTMNAVEIAGSSFLQLRNGGDSTEISPQYGISTSQGLSVSGKSNFYGPTQFRAGVDFSSQNLSNVNVIYFSNGSFLNSTNGGQLWFYNSGTGQSVRLDK